MYSTMKFSMKGAVVAAALMMGGAVTSLDASAATAAVTQTTLSALKSLTAPGWSFGSQAGGTLTLSTNTALNYLGDATSIKGTYPVANGNVYVWSAYDLSALATRDIYVEFWAKMPAAKEGLKFLKVFGSNAAGAGNGANTTFALDYTGYDFGCMYQVSFGDGTSVGNDTANVINFDGTTPSLIGRSYGKATVSTPQKKRWAAANWGTTWHHFRMHVKFNSGTSAATEVNDGAYYVEIDGVVYVDASGLFNRHWSNAPIDRVELFGWTQNASSAFEVWYDKVSITTGGFLTSTAGDSAPAAPANVLIKAN